MESWVSNYLASHRSAIDGLADSASNIADAAKLCVDALRRGNKLLICGNGGSAADAQHLAAELVGRFVNDRKALPAIALTTDTSALTAIANDYGYDSVFSRQVAALAQSGDVLLAISTSGHSANVLAACEQARSMDCRVLALSGRDGGALTAMSDVAVVAPSSETAHIQECHIVVVHMLCALIEQGLDLA